MSASCERCGRALIDVTAELGKMAERISALQVQLGQLPVLKAVA